MRYFAFFRERPLVCFAICYGLGILAGYALGAVQLFVLVALILSVLLGAIRWSCERSVWPCAALAFFFLGMLLCQIKAYPDVPAGGKYTVNASVTGNVKQEETGRLKTYLTDVRLTDENGTESTWGKAYLTYTPDEDEQIVFRDGTRLEMNATVYAPSGRSNPYGFDFKEYLLTQGVGYGISCYGGAVITGQGSNGLSSSVYDLRESLRIRCRDIFGEQSALPLALLLGFRDDLPDDVRDTFSDAGISHVLAVSGLHVTLLAGALLLLLKPFHLSPTVKLILVSAFLLFYCLIVGFSAPVVRASILTVTGMVAAAVKRRSDPLTALAVAFLVILLISPLQLLTASFILSFSAVTGLILFGDLFSTVKPQNPFVSKLWNWWKATFAATLGVSVPMILFFHSFSLIGLVINPFVCALIGVILPLYACIFVIGCIYLPAGMLLGNLISGVTALFTDSVSFLAELPYATVRAAAPGLAVILSLLVFLIVLTRYSMIEKRKKQAVCLVSAAVFALTAFLGRDRSLRYVQLSVGQEDCALLIDDRETIVIDTGENGSDLSSYMLSMGLKADKVIISHMHTDHIGGINELLDNDVPIGEVCLPVNAESFAAYTALQTLQRVKDAGIPVKTLSKGDVIRTARSEISVLWPEEGKVNAGADANTYALALIINLDGVRLLNMTDVSGTYENYSAVPADILKVSHHGSKSSTGTEFLEAVQPDIALISENGRSASLPSPVTLERFSESGTEVYLTSAGGALTIVCRDGKYTLKTYRGLP